MSKKILMLGQTYTRLTVIEEVGIRCRCTCVCKKEVFVRREDLRSGKTKSCGCLHKERTSQSRLKHGRSRERLYRVWLAMRKRCNNPSNRDYHRYGGRGIKVCSEWEDYSIFRVWAINMNYSPELEIDRLDNNKDYKPDNCAWVTHKQNCSHTQKTENALISYNGKTQSWKSWANELGVTKRCLTGRNDRGWSIEKTLTTPVTVERKDLRL